MLRELSGLSRPPAQGGDKKEVDSAAFVRENVLTAKTGAAEQMMEAVGGAVCGRTEQLVGRLMLGPSRDTWVTSTFPFPYT